MLEHCRIVSKLALLVSIRDPGYFCTVQASWGAPSAPSMGPRVCQRVATNPGQDALGWWRPRMGEEESDTFSAEGVLPLCPGGLGCEYGRLGQARGSS